MAALKEVMISAPGKVILHGEHAVVYGKVAVAASLNLRTYMKVSINESVLGVSVSLPDIKLERNWSTDELKKVFSSRPCDAKNPQPPSKEVLEKLYKFAELESEEDNTKKLALVSFLYLFLSINWRDDGLVPVKVDLSSSLPPGAGLGSSAAFSTCLSAGLLLTQDLVSMPAVVSGENQATWHQKPEDLELINKWAFMGEKIIHGNPSGIDNSISTYGGALKFQKGELTQMDKTPQLQILLSNTGVPRSTKKMVAGLREKLNKYPKIIEPVLESVQAISEEGMKILTEMATHEQSDAKLGSLFSTLEDLVDMNQYHLNIMGVGHPKLDEVCLISLKHNLHAKLTGAGGGGCAFTLLPAGTSMERVKNLQNDLKMAGIDSWVTSIGGNGVSYHLDLKGESNVPDLFQG